MKSKAAVLLWCLVLGIDFACAQVPAFPGAAGFGARTFGGSGRHLSPPSTKLYRVTSLSDAGPGSLRECAETAGPRVCVFEVSGKVLLSGSLKFRHPYVTVAGQTAPSPGIMLQGAGLEIYTHDVIVQHLEVRVGDAPDGPPPGARDGVSVRESAHNVIVDHVSISWAVDENLSTGNKNVHDVTFSNLLVSEALYRSIHPKGRHSMGVLIGDHSKNISLLNSLFAHNVERNPRLKLGVSAEVLNNVFYHWGGRSSWNTANVSDAERSSPILLHFAGNYYKPGPGSPLGRFVFGRPVAEGTRIFLGSNFGPSRMSAEQDPWDAADLPETPYRARQPAFAGSGAETLEPEAALERVMTNAGSRPAERNAVDEKVLSEVRQGTGSFKDCVTGCARAAGGWPSLGTQKRSFPEVAAPNNDEDHDGYTNLEHELHRFSALVERR